jgi:hypothetical protein
MVPYTAPGPGEALVQVSAAGVNFMDIGVRTGKFWPDKVPPFGLGVEGAGRGSRRRRRYAARRRSCRLVLRARELCRADRRACRRASADPGRDQRRDRGKFDDAGPYGQPFP